jgi:hypothetical protein
MTKGPAALVNELIAQGLCREGLNKREQMSLLQQALIRTKLCLVPTSKLSSLKRLCDDTMMDCKPAAPAPAVVNEDESVVI